MSTATMITLGCGLLFVTVIAILVKAFGRFLFQNPCEGDGNFNPPMDLFYEEYEEDEKDHRRN